jgi:hypothetical protein
MANSNLYKDSMAPRWSTGGRGGFLLFFLGSHIQETELEEITKNSISMQVMRFSIYQLYTANFYMYRSLTDQMRSSQ